MRLASGIFVFFFLMTLAICHPGFGQEQKPESDKEGKDTLRMDQHPVIQQGATVTPDTAIIKKVSKLDPKKAALFAAAFPGLGQIYNGKYWKLPIVYGGFAALGYALALNNDRYQLFRRALIAVQNGDPEENPLDGIRGQFEVQANLQNYVENFRRFRDLNIILIAGLYGLQIMDAIVDAHLIEFDVNEDLSFRLQPAAAGGAADFSSVPQYGLSLTFNIK